MASAKQRLDRLEAKLRYRFPDYYQRYLLSGRNDSESDAEFEVDGFEYDIRTIFGLTDGDECAQLDGILDLVGDVLPPGSVAIGTDWGSNFYLKFPDSEAVHYWDHERDLGDDTTEVIHRDLGSFLELANPKPK
jgi:hypothetical protein